MVHTRKENAGGLESLLSDVGQLLGLAAAHHPLRLIGAGMLAGLIGCVDADGAYHPRTHLEHPALGLLQVPELWDEWVQPDRALAVADWATVANGPFEAETTSVERLTRERVFDDPHARLSAQQWYWYDPVLVEAEIERPRTSPRSSGSPCV